MKRAKIIWNLFLLVILASSATTAMAQEELNPRYPFYVGSFDYKKPDALSTIGGIVGVLGGSNDHNKVLSTEDQSMVPGILEAIQTACSKVYRLVVQQGNAPQSSAEEAYLLNGIISRVMSGSGSYGLASANLEFHLTNIKTGKEVASQKYECVAGNQCFPTKADAIAGLSQDISARTMQFLIANFPLTGSVLQKGVEQLNGKVKQKQCYIDLGDKFGVYAKMPFAVYTDDNGDLKEIGKMKAKESEGDDIYVCTITKGDKKITEALQNGKKLVVKTSVKAKQAFVF